MERFDVIVVGAGPAGSTCARFLVQAGWRTLILEKTVFPRKKVCAGWITITNVLGSLPGATFSSQKEDLPE